MYKKIYAFANFWNIAFLNADHIRADKFVKINLPNWDILSPTPYLTLMGKLWVSIGSSLGKNYNVLMGASYNMVTQQFAQFPKWAFICSLL